MTPPLSSSSDPTRDVAEEIARISGGEVVEREHHFTIVARCAWCKTSDPTGHDVDCPYRKDPK